MNTQELVGLSALMSFVASGVPRALIRSIHIQPWRKGCTEEDLIDSE